MTSTLMPRRRASIEANRPIANIGASSTANKNFSRFTTIRRQKLIAVAYLDSGGAPQPTILSQRYDQHEYLRNDPEPMSQPRQA